MPSVRSVRKTLYRTTRSSGKWLLWTAWCLGSMMALWMIHATFSVSRSVPPKRVCTVPWPALERTNNELKICITTLSDANLQSKYSKSARRDFSDVLDATWDNKVQYAAKHKYTLINASQLVTVERPPSWSKILAVQDALLTEKCTWVFWMDPDSLIMNSQFELEDILPSNEKIDLIITKDVTGYNAGMWMVRNSNWTRQFLNEWWSMTSFIRPTGDTKSGDNDALKTLLEQLEDRREHVYVAPQCAFNSYLWTASLKSWGRYLWDKQIVLEGTYAEGDFIMHLAGIDDKMSFIEEYQEKAI